jgi:hypothetical protein
MESKRSYYDKLVINSKNRTKTTWNIVKSLTGRKPNHEAVPLNDFCNSYINPKMIWDMWESDVYKTSSAFDKKTTS